MYAAKMMARYATGRLFAPPRVTGFFWAVTQPAYPDGRPAVVLDAEEDGAPLDESRARAYAHVLNTERASDDAKWATTEVW
jgi:hypothetical protein